MKLIQEKFFLLVFTALSWTGIVIWLFGLGWMGGFIAALISLPVINFSTESLEEEETERKLKKLEKIEKAAETKRKLDILERIERAST